MASIIYAARRGRSGRHEHFPLCLLKQQTFPTGVGAESLASLGHLPGLMTPVVAPGGTTTSPCACRRKTPLRCLATDRARDRAKAVAKKSAKVGGGRFPSMEAYLKTFKRRGGGRTALQPVPLAVWLSKADSDHPPVYPFGWPTQSSS